MCIATILWSENVASELDTAQLYRWDLEVNTSLRQNFQDMSCALSILPSSSPFDPQRLPLTNTSIFVRKIYPSERDLHFLRVLPESLSAADVNVPEFAAKRDYSYEKWGKETILRWEIPYSHPGQNRNNCISMTKLASEGVPVSFYQEFRGIDRIPYISYFKNGFVHPSGSVASSCGYYQGQEGCETRWNRAHDWFRACQQAIINYSSYLAGQKPDHRTQFADWSIFSRLLSSTSTASSVSREELYLWKQCMTFAEEDTPYGGKPPHLYIANQSRPMEVDTVVVIPALWDFNYHHFLADSLARLTLLLPLLRRRPDIFIHVRAAETYDGMYHMDSRFIASAQAMRSRIFLYLGLDPERIIWGPVIANVVMLPRPTRCSFALSNPVELLKLRQALIGGTLKKVREETVSGRNDIEAVQWKAQIMHFLHLTQSLWTSGMKATLSTIMRENNLGSVVDSQARPENVATTLRAIPGQGSMGKKTNLKQQARSQLHKQFPTSVFEQPAVRFRHRKKAPKPNPSVKPPIESDTPILPERKLSTDSNMTAIELSSSHRALSDGAAHLISDILPSEHTLKQIGEKEDTKFTSPHDPPMTMISHFADAKLHQKSNENAHNYPWKLRADYQSPTRKKLVLQQRFTPFASTDRDWSDRTTQRLSSALQSTFPQHDIVIISSAKQQQKKGAGHCLHCDFLHWMTADIVVSAHGAGMTNLVLVSPHTVVIEITGEVKDVNLPVCGYYGPLSSLVGGHHYLYAHDMSPPFPSATPDDRQQLLHVLMPEQEKIAIRRENEAQRAARLRNSDYALPVYDIAVKARRFYDTIQQQRRSMEANRERVGQNANPANDNVVVQPVDMSPAANSVLQQRVEVRARASFAEFQPHGPTFIRVENCTEGMVPARP
jgi:hypothetical protein